MMETLAKFILIVWSTLVLFTDVFSFDTYYGNFNLVFKILAVAVLFMVSYTTMKE